MTVEEFEMEMVLFREQKDPICRYRNPLIGLYQFQFITRCDDVCNFKVEDPKSHPYYDMALSQKVKWSKNVRDARNCPDQLLLASKEHKNCLFLALGLWLEYYLRIHPEATYMMTNGLPEGKTKKQHKKFTEQTKGHLVYTANGRWDLHKQKGEELEEIKSITVEDGCQKKAARLLTRYI
jgi:DNA phosphorothioation-dependent restriction protein DptG